MTHSTSEFELLVFLDRTIGPDPQIQEVSRSHQSSISIVNIGAFRWMHPSKADGSSKLAGIVLSYTLARTTDFILNDT
jgi:hypothetical protein